jgi:pimeloyl-ACP methyl ester carboxylesterase
LTDIGLSASWRLGRLLGPSIVEKSLARPLGRRAGLGWISAQAQELPRQLALQSARAAIASKHFPEHFRQTRKLRFTDGHLIPATVAIRVIWGERDHVAPANRSRSMSELPGHARSETWPECGHMIMWDQMAQTIQAALETVHVQSSPPLALPD